MVLFFEILPSEIFFELFDYLTIFDIFYSFINLNKRINDIISFYPIELDFQRITRSKFDFICRYIRPQQVQSIYLSDELMPDQVELINKYFSEFKYKFIYLKKIQFINTSTILSNLPICLSSLSIKTYLKTKITDYHITQVLNQQAKYLTYLKVDGSYVFKFIDTSFPLLTHLTIDYCTLKDFHRIIQLIKSPLIYLKLSLDKDDNINILNFNQVSNSLRYLTVIFSEEILMSFEIIKQYIKDLFKLTVLIIQATGTLDLLNGQLWEEYLCKRDIKKFYFKFTLSNNIDCPEDKHSLIQSFRSSFWIEKNHWYVACDKGQLKSSRPTIYSIPYFQPPLIFYPSNSSQPVSTLEKDIISKHPINLIITFHKTIPIPTSPFNHVYSLTLLTSTLPSIEILESIVNLKQIRELDISLVKSLSVEDFQILLDTMINLKNLKMYYNPLFAPPLRIHSYTFIRQDRESSVIHTNNIQRFCYLFFHIKYLEITVQSKDIIIQLLNQLHYLERVKIFCYLEYLMSIRKNWFLEYIPRFNTIHFTFRTTASSLFLSIGNKKVRSSCSIMSDDRRMMANNERRTIGCGWCKSHSHCVVQ